MLKGQHGKVYGPGVPGYEGATGVITLTTPPLRGLDDRLFRILRMMVDELGVSINILSVDTGQHVPGSRHYHGRAVDVDHIGGLPVGWANSHIDQGRVQHWLRSHCFGPAEDGLDGHVRALLFGPPESSGNRSSLPHLHHMHISVGVNG